PDVPDRYWWGLVAGQPTPQALRADLDQRNPVRPGVLGGAGGHRRWAAGLRAVLRPGLLYQRPDADPANLEGRHVLPRRIARRAAGDLVVLPQASGGLLPADGFHCTAGANRPGRRPHR